MGAMRCECVRCKGEFVVPVRTDLSVKEVLDRRRTYLCPRCRRPVTEEDIAKLAKEGLVA